MPDESVFLFVYGTLMPGGYYYPRISEHVRRWQSAWCQGALIDVGWYPALVEGDGLVRGVLLHLAPQGLVVTDHIERYTPGSPDNEYIRSEVELWLGQGTPSEHGRTLCAWTYFYADPSQLADRPRLVRAVQQGRPLYDWSPTASPDPSRLPG